MVEDLNVYAPFFGAFGSASSVILCAFGAAYATARAGIAISTAATVHPEGVMKSLLPVVMGGIIAIYGLVDAVLIANYIEQAPKYTPYTGYLHFGSGLAVGLTGLGAGYAIGETGASGVLCTVHQPNFFVGMILILIFSEVIGLYGLILGLILSAKI